MTHSTWGDWFLTHEIEGTEPETLTIWYLGCNGFVLRTAETTVYIDPYFGDSRPPRLLRMIPVPMDARDASLADAVLVTHEHLDHMHPPSYEPLVADLGADLYAPRSAYEEPDESVDTSVLDGRDHVIEPGNSVTIGDLTVHVEAGNDPDAIEEVTYVIEHEDGTFFHGGDTRYAESFEDLGERYDIDVGVLAIGTMGRQYYPESDEVRTRKVYMDEDDVIQTANALQFNRLAPSHHGMWKGVTGDLSSLSTHSKSFEYPSVIEAIEVGDQLRIDSPGTVPPRILDTPD